MPGRVDPSRCPSLFQTIECNMILQLIDYSIVVFYLLKYAIAKISRTFFITDILRFVYITIFSYLWAVNKFVFIYSKPSCYGFWSFKNRTNFRNFVFEGKSLRDVFYIIWNKGQAGWKLIQDILTVNHSFMDFKKLKKTIILTI